MEITHAGRIVVEVS